MTDTASSTSTMPLVLVTGARGRLGTIIADSFLDAGYRVVGLDRSASDEGQPSIMAFDATDETSVRSAFERVVREKGVPSIVIHTVGMWAMSPFTETALSDWRKMMEVNLTSTFLVFREALRQLHQADQPVPGRLIGISSKQGSIRGMAQQAAYSASKAGVMRLVEALSAEVAGTGTTAHAIAPSMILFDDEEGEGVSAKDIAAHCLHLASEAGASLNGATLQAFGT